MTSKEHVKHTKLVRPQGGGYHRDEVAFLGAPCADIQQLSQKLSLAWKDLRVGYVDADQGDDKEEATFHTRYTDMISHHALVFDHRDISYENRAIYDKCDLVLVNGNHFKAARQVVIINPKKEESLRGKLDQLTDVKMILLDGLDAPFEFVQAHLDGKKVPILPISQINAIAGELKSELIVRPVLKGLVFAGGHSIRMGRDKGMIDYHGKPQREYVANLLDDLCEQTYLSVQADANVDANYPLLRDTFIGLGPYGGLLSAFREDPNAAWFAVACDVPLLDQESLGRLVAERDSSKTATCYHNPIGNFPEPLITIWEPRAYRHLLHLLSLGYSCVRKALINAEVNELEISDFDKLMNVNTPEDYIKVKSLINV